MSGLIFAIIAILIAIAISVNEYKKSKNDEVRRAKFMNDMKAVGITALIMFGIAGSCVGCLYSQDSSSSGSYHNRETGEKQIQYQDSREQQKDLNDIDNYARDHPGF